MYSTNNDKVWMLSFYVLYAHQHKAIVDEENERQKYRKLKSEWRDESIVCNVYKYAHIHGTSILSKTSLPSFILIFQSFSYVNDCNLMLTEWFEKY